MRRACSLSDAYSAASGSATGQGGGGRRVCRGPPGIRVRVRGDVQREGDVHAQGWGGPAQDQCSGCSAAGAPGRVGERNRKAPHARGPAVRTVAPGYSFSSPHGQRSARGRSPTGVQRLCAARDAWRGDVTGGPPPARAHALPQSRCHRRLGFGLWGSGRWRARRQGSRGARQRQAGLTALVQPRTAHAPCIGPPLFQGYVPTGGMEPSLTCERHTEASTSSSFSTSRRAWEQEGGEGGRT